MKLTPEQIQAAFEEARIEHEQREKFANVVDAFSVEKSFLYEGLKDEPKLQDLIIVGHEELASFPLLAEDLYLCLWQYRPEIRDDENLCDFALFHKDIIREILERPEYRELRVYTRLDPVSSVLACYAIFDAVIKYIIEYKEDEEQRQQIEEQNQQACQGEHASDILQSLQSWLGSDAGLSSIHTDKSNADGNQNGDQSIDADPNGNSDDGREDNSAPQEISISPNFIEGLKKALIKSIKDASDNIEESREIAHAWGIESGQATRNTSLTELIQSLERCLDSKKIRDISNILGRFRKIADKVIRESQRTSKTHFTIKGLTQGDNLPKVLPSEMAKKNHPVARAEFITNYLDKTLFQYETEDPDPEGRGPIVCCVDISGSMDGIKEMWAKAVMSAFLQVCRQQKRDFAGILFEYEVVSVKRVLKDETGIDKVLDLIETTTRGGTDFEKPLRKAAEIINESRFKKADILFITDGECNISDEFLHEFKAEQRRKEFRVVSILIAPDDEERAEEVLRQFSDKIVCLPTLMDLNDQRAEEIIRHIVIGGDTEDES